MNVLGLIAATGILFIYPFTDVTLGTIQCAIPDAVPYKRACAVDEAKASYEGRESERPCSTFFITADNKLLIAGWEIFGPFPLCIPSDNPANDTEYYCKLWEIFGDYILWEDGNPCGGKV